MKKRKEVKGGKLKKGSLRKEVKGRKLKDGKKEGS